MSSSPSQISCHASWLGQSQRRTVGIFALIVVQHQQFEPRATASLRVFQHFPVATVIAERGDRPAADMLVDANGFAAFIVERFISGRRTRTGLPSRISN